MRKIPVSLMGNLIILLMFSQTVSAKWVSTNGPGGGEIHVLAMNGDNIFAGTYDAGVFVSADNGARWVAANNGLTNMMVWAFAFIGDSVFTGTDSGVFLSVNRGESWVVIDSGLLDTRVRSLSVFGDTVVASTRGGIFCLKNNDASWHYIPSDSQNIVIHSIYTNGDTVFTTTNRGTHTFLNTPAGWKTIHSGSTLINFKCIVMNGGIGWAGHTFDGVFTTTNGGDSWAKSNSGLANTRVSSLAVKGDTVFAGTMGGVFRSIDNGATWGAVNNGLTNLGIRALLIKGDDIFAGTSGAGAYLSTDNGANWTMANAGLTNVKVKALMADGDTLFVGLPFGNGIHRSVDGGMNWAAVYSGLPTNVSVYDFMKRGTMVFAGTDEGVFYTTNNGEKWVVASSGLRSATNQDVQALAMIDSAIFAGTVDHGVYRSTNAGTTWTSTDSVSIQQNINCLAVNGNDIFAGTYEGVYRSTTMGANWDKVSYGFPEGDRVDHPSVACLAVCGDTIFVSYYSYGIFRSADNGTTWSQLPSFIPPGNTYQWNPVLSFVVNGNIIFAGTLGAGIFHTADYGASWCEDNEGLTNLNITALSVGGNNLYAGISGDCLWRRPLSEMIPVNNKKPQSMPRIPPNVEMEIIIRSNHDAAVLLHLYRPEMVSVKIFNPAGAEMASLVNKKIGPGFYRLPLITADIATGCYVARILAGPLCYIKNIPVIR